MAKKKAKPAKAKKTVKKKSAPKKSAAKKIVKKAVKAVKKIVSSAKRVQGVLPKPVISKTSRREILLGEVEDYYAHVGVIALVSKESLAVGDKIHIKGHTTDLDQPCASMQIDHKNVTSIKKGDSVGIKVNDRCRKGDKVFKVL